MNYSYFRNIDLNLLIVFLTLLKNSSVSKSAKELHMTQPAVSESLKRLRHMFNDELFIRTGRTITATDMALSYKNDLENLFEKMDSIFEERKEFDPSIANNHIKIGLPEYCAIPVIPKLQKLLIKQAPNIQITTVNTNIKNSTSILENKEVDFVIGHFEKTPKSISNHILYNDKYIGIMSAENTCEITNIDEYFSNKHLHVSLRGENSGYIDQYLKRNNLGDREINVTLSNYIFSLNYLEKSNLIATEPYFAIKDIINRFDLKTFELPFKAPAIQISLGVLKTRENLPVIKWFSNMIQQAICD